ncbi:hypothetical protein EFK13_06675 [Bacillus cabrialesii]|uniref:hypothetical protein n=1 Tax=Bacillus cabrialesii TaxID=2487276 RepID=UPI001012D441|nr:hypothetical protein [Bacillus cabrialesii]UQE80246.1 hypothetical protein EFK13_06675 [Bacillus cabrialesii]
MKIRQRIIKSEKVLSTIKSKQGKNEINPVLSWLIENNREFRECLKQLWRLRWKAEQGTYQWERWQEPYREQAGTLVKRMDELLEKHKDCFDNKT